jgi:hypothetical protein
VSDIRVGDLVMVVKSCCGEMAKHKHFGGVFTVTGFNTGVLGCRHCGFRVSTATWAEFGGPLGWYVPFLQRIHPLDELERDQIVEELTA